jgi:hypothetical protein
VQHLFWLSQNELTAVLDASDGLGFKLTQFEISEPVDGKALLTSSFETRLDYKPFNTDYNVKSGHLAVQSTEGKVYKYSNLLFYSHLNSTSMKYYFVSRIKWQSLDIG